MKSLEGSSLSLPLDGTFPPRIRIPQFVLYNDTSCIKIHVTIIQYCDIMVTCTAAGGRGVRNPIFKDVTIIRPKY